MYNASKLAFAALALVLTGVIAAQGQVNGSMLATAQVQPPITVSGTQNLSFGNVFPGVAKAVAYTDAANAGKFSVAGQASTPVTYSFTLPTNLTSGGNNLPIGSWLGYENTSNSTSGGSGITPSAAPTSSTLSGSGALFFFVGATVTPRTSAANAGQFDVTGPHDSQAALTFTLPVVMTGPAGATLPLLFGGSDAGYSQSQSIGSQIGFDPKQPFVITFSQNGRGSVFLGGTAQPVPTQRAGSYTATITLTVVSLP